MTQQFVCLECGAEFSNGSSAGVCPKCLLSAGLDTEKPATSSTGEAETLVRNDVDQNPIPLQVGKSFGDYHLIEEVARGGMGVVYKARQLSLNRTVAVKMILSGELASPSDIARFQTEAEAAANLQHPNVVAIHEVGEIGGQHFFSMDFVEGKSLAEIIRRNPFNPKVAARLVAKIANAIQCAHDHGTLHRDLKPQNILIDHSGEPKVTDFGLAKQFQADSGITDTGQALGTPSYMPPEQASGNIDELAPTADVYSIGAILYELLTGRPPFRAETALDTMMQVLEDEPVAPRLLNSSIPKDIETICLKCLQKDSKDRYPSAIELKQDLDRFLDDQPILARPIGRFEKLVRASRQNARVIRTVSISMVAVMLLLGGLMITRTLMASVRSGTLMLRSQRGSVNVELMNHDDDQVIESFALPMKEPLRLTEGDYRLRLSAPGRLSQTSKVYIQRNYAHDFDVELTESRSKNFLPLDKDDYFEAVDFGATNGLLLMDHRFGEVTLRRLDTDQYKSIWALRLDRNHVPKAFADAPNIWKQFVGVWSSNRRAARPTLLNPAPDIDDDGINDLIWYWPLMNDAFFLAQNGSTGEIVWWSAKTSGTWLTSIPMVWPQADHGHMVVSLRKKGQHWLEAIRLTDGQQAWKLELESSAVDAAGPFLEIDQLAGRRKLISAFRLDAITIDHQQMIGFATDQKLWCISTAGKTNGPPQRLLSPATQAIQFADIDADGTTDALVVSRKDDDDKNFRVISFKNGQEIWAATIQETKENLRSQLSTRFPLPLTLNDAESPFIVTANQADQEDEQLTLNLLDGRTGEPIWEQPKTVSFYENSYVEQVMAYPDVNGDGWRELVVVSLCQLTQHSSRNRALTVDLVSGRDGQTLNSWVTLRKLSSRSVSQVVTFAGFWDWESHGTRKLVLGFTETELRAGGNESNNTVFVVSLARGTTLQESNGVGSLFLTDISNDQLTDLGFVREASSDRQLTINLGRMPRIWQRLSNAQVAHDFNGDGILDLVDEPPPTANFSGQVHVYSGKDGSFLSNWRIRWHDRQMTKLSELLCPKGDLDADGVNDVIALNSFRGGRQDDANGKAAIPLALQAISGKTGRKIYEVDKIPSHHTLSKSDRVTSYTTDVRVVNLDGDKDRELLVASHQVVRESSVHMRQYLSLFSSTNGDLIWSCPTPGSMKTSSRVYSESDLPMYWAEELVDMNQDGHKDILCSAPTKTIESDYSFEIFVLSGKDGSLIWDSHKLDYEFKVSDMRTVYSPNLESVIPKPVMLDTNQDGSVEILFLDRTLHVNQESKLHLMALNAANGKQTRLWSANDSVNRTKIPAIRILRDATGLARVAISSAHNNESSVSIFVPGEGSMVVLCNHQIRHPDDFMILDVNKDDVDDLVLIDKQHQLQSWDRKRLHWSWPLPSADCRIKHTVGYLNSEDIIVASKQKGRWYGIDPLTGKTRWVGEAGGRNTNSNGLGVVETPLLFSNVRDSGFGRTGGIFATHSLVATSENGLAFPQSPKISRRTRDPRRIRPLPWVPQSDGMVDIRFNMFRPVAMSFVMGITIVIIPGRFLWAAIKRGQWNLRQWLLLPFVVGLALLSFQHFIRDHFFQQFQDRSAMFMAVWLIIVGSTMAIFPTLVLMRSLRKQWVDVVWLFVVAGVFSCITGALMIFLDRWLSPAEQDYQMTGWYFVLLMGAYFAGCGWLAWQVMRWVWSTIWGVMRSGGNIRHD